MPAASASSENIRLIDEGAAYLSLPARVQKARAGRYTLPGFDPKDWRQTADLGWLGLRLEEARGGIGFGAAELCAFAEQMGAGLVPEPLLAAMLAIPILPDDWLTPVLAGEVIVLPALQEQGSAFDAPSSLPSEARRLTGEKQYIPMAAGANAFLVSTRDGFALVDADAKGTDLEILQTQDGGHFGRLGLHGVEALPLPAPSHVHDRLQDELALATSAYLLGVMRRAFTITADYLGQREQFGKPIGSFQSLQHRMVDLHIQIELTAASVRQAAIKLDSADADAGRLAVSRAKARASDAAMLVTRQGVQLHGGVGYTDEIDIGLYLRKAMTLANLHGSAAAHRSRFARLTDLGNVQ